MLLEDFYNTIPNASNLSSSMLIPYFALYCSEESEYFTSAQILKCFNELNLKPYSNIPKFLKDKSSGKNSKFLRNKSGYKIIRTYQQELLSSLIDNEIIRYTNNLFDITLLDIPNVPFYFKKIVEQMCACYDQKLYTACFAMIRKLIETLIIECFERYSIEEDIKDKNGEFFYLNILIDKYIVSKKWNASRNINKSFKQIKKYGDLSVHNRRLFATKTDIDNMKDEMRQSVQEIILTIDYPNWQRC